MTKVMIWRTKTPNKIHVHYMYYTTFIKVICIYKFAKKQSLREKTLKCGKNLFYIIETALTLD